MNKMHFEKLSFIIKNNDKSYLENLLKIDVKTYLQS